MAVLSRVQLMKKRGFEILFPDIDDGYFENIMNSINDTLSEMPDNPDYKEFLTKLYNSLNSKDKFDKRLLKDEKALLRIKSMIENYAKLSSYGDKRYECKKIAGILCEFTDETKQTNLLMLLDRFRDNLPTHVFCLESMCVMYNSGHAGLYCKFNNDKTTDIFDHVDTRGLFMIFIGLHNITDTYKKLFILFHEFSHHYFEHLVNVDYIKSFANDVISTSQVFTLSNIIQDAFINEYLFETGKFQRSLINRLCDFNMLYTKLGITDMNGNILDIKKVKQSDWKEIFEMTIKIFKENKEAREMIENTLERFGDETKSMKKAEENRKRLNQIAEDVKNGKMSKQEAMERLRDMENGGSGRSDDERESEIKADKIDQEIKPNYENNKKDSIDKSEELVNTPMENIFDDVINDMVKKANDKEMEDIVDKIDKNGKSPHKNGKKDVDEAVNDAMKEISSDMNIDELYDFGSVLKGIGDDYSTISKKKGFDNSHKSDEIIDSINEVLRMINKGEIKKDINKAKEEIIGKITNKVDEVKKEIEL